MGLFWRLSCAISSDISFVGDAIERGMERFCLFVSKKKHFVGELIIFFLIYLLLESVIVFFASKFGIDIFPKNNENVSTQLHTIPLPFTFIQTCVFAPVIEETTFRYSIIGQTEKENRALLIVLCIISVIVFDAIHIFTFREFFYYLAPAIVLTTFYVRRKSVIASMILHSSLNIIGTFMLLFQ